MSLTFDDYLTADWSATWDSPVDLRWLFDTLALWPGLCWVMRGDPEHRYAQLSGVPAFDWQESMTIEIRLVETPHLDALTFFLVLSELNKRNHMDARLEEIHLCWYQSLVDKLPAVNVPYTGRA
ncbi:hypothetical protein [Pseudomonas akapageensis]|uniref:hypothetical protein n=1 Tax=Pseudomonas akapageensis TaxID=2609961 RepID=UPI00140E41E9|nr:hypothetical protein [Pseudomonas akapageensis]